MVNAVEGLKYFFKLDACCKIKQKTRLLIIWMKNMQHAICFQELTGLTANQTCLLQPYYCLNQLVAYATFCLILRSLCKIIL